MQSLSESGLAARLDGALAFVPAMARRLFNETKLVRRFTVARSFGEAEAEERKEWRAMSPLERLAAVELWRQMNHADYDPDTARLPRVFEIVAPASR